MTVKHLKKIISLFIPTRNASQLQSSNSHIFNLDYSICYRTNSVELDNVQSAKHVITFLHHQKISLSRLTFI